MEEICEAVSIKTHQYILSVATLAWCRDLKCELTLGIKESYRLILTVTEKMDINSLYIIFLDKKDLKIIL